MADLSQKLLGAGAAAKNDWAHASAETGLNFTGRARFRRGIEVEIGLDALATADAGLSKFVDASIRGNAFAEARASLQLQLPLNLFDEFGLAVGAQAVAQAAAGIEVGLAAIAGDIIELAARTATAPACRSTCCCSCSTKRSSAAISRFTSPRRRWRMRR